MTRLNPPAAKVGWRLPAFLLFAAALLVVGPAEASRTTTDARSSLASSSSRELVSLELPSLDALEPLDSVDASLHFGFGEDLGLLDPEAGPGGFVVLARETSRCELTYARNNPLKYVDPDGNVVKNAPLISPQVRNDVREGVNAVLGAGEALFSLAGMGGEARLATAPLRDLTSFLLPESSNEQMLAATSLLLLASGAGGVSPNASKFFEGARYTPKVLTQMEGGDAHSFPLLIDELAKTAGEVTSFTGGDRKTYLQLTVEGVKNGEKGVFQYIKDAAGNINRRIFWKAADWEKWQKTNLSGTE